LFIAIRNTQEKNERLQQSRQAIYILLSNSLKSTLLEHQLHVALDVIFSVPWVRFQSKGIIFLMNNECDVLEMAAQRGLGEPLLTSCAKVPLGKCLCGRTARDRSIHFTNKVDEQCKGQSTGMEHRGHYCIPILSSDQLLGVITLYLSEGHIQNDEEKEFLLSIANTLAGIIERKQMEEKLQKAKQKAEEATWAKSSFLATMSHDIRTPMNAILGMGEVLRDSGLNKEQGNALKVMTHAGENLLSLINDILDLSKVESGQLQIETVSFDLYELIEKTHYILLHQARDKGLDSIPVIKSDCPNFVIGDPQRLRQILINLLGNAIKFTESGKITLMVEPHRTDLIQFTVSDTGVGIPQEQLENIFDPFQQADNSTSRHFGGTGLGLSICKQLVRAMGGEIQVESEFGKGSTFHFTARLPKSEEALSDETLTHVTRIQERKNESQESIRLETMNILLVDDAEDNLMVISAFLNNTPYHLETEDNGKKAVETFKSKPFDLVIMDMHMPVLDGYSATKQIRAWENEQNRSRTPIIALTANAMKDDIDKTAEAGCDLHLSKPVRKAWLIEVIRDFQKKSGTTSDTFSSQKIKETSESHHDTYRPSAINKETLEQLRQDIDDEIEPTLKRFLEKLPQRLEDISKAVNKGKSNQAVKAAHKLKGAAATFGAQRLSMLCHELEISENPDLLRRDGQLLTSILEEGKLVHEEIRAVLEGEL
jgi:signal transduction histidine kinase/CheY-like chemotaxis protein/HPt (histidine-containing phosphotransfer) domain-containing protein